MKKLKLFLFIISIFILGTIIVSAASIITTMEVGINPPTASISASPTSVAYGTSSKLTWSSTNATSCTANGDWSGSQNISGTDFSTGPITKDSTFSISCTGPGGTSLPSSATVATVKIIPPTGTLSATDCIISAGATTCSTTLKWSVSNPIPTPAVTTNYPSANTIVSTLNSSTKTLYSIPQGSTTFYLYDNNVILATAIAKATVAVPATPTGLSASANSVEQELLIFHGNLLQELQVTHFEMEQLLSIQVLLFHILR